MSAHPLQQPLECPDMVPTRAPTDGLGVSWWQLGWRTWQRGPAITHGQCVQCGLLYTPGWSCVIEVAMFPAWWRCTGAPA